MKRESVADIKHCYGCGVCVAACPHHVIELRHDKQGFYYPQIKKKDLCTNCGICHDVCSYVHERLVENQGVLEYKAMWSLDDEVRNTCSSGGAAYEIAVEAIKLGYIIIAVRYNADKHRAEHCLCHSVEELKDTCGSKYIQSYTSSAFLKIDKKKKYLVVGTPCQADSLRRWIKKLKVEDNFILVDFFCHGVPSYWIWQKYLNENFNNISIDKITFRTKRNYKTKQIHPWHDSFLVTCNDKNGIKYQPNINKKDWFYHYFLNDICLGCACYSCKFKMYKSSADIRLGDAWGSVFDKNEKGVSAVLVYTKRGKDILSLCKNLASKYVNLSELCEGQMQESPPQPKYYNLRLWLVHNTALSLKSVDDAIRFINRIKNKFKFFFR